MKFQALAGFLCTQGAPPRVCYGIVTGTGLPRAGGSLLDQSPIEAPGASSASSRSVGAEPSAITDPAASNMTVAVHHPSLVDKLRHEVIRLGVISLYVYICLGAVMLYKTALLRKYSIEFTPLGIAAVKSLIIAKFIMLGHTFRLG